MTMTQPDPSAPIARAAQAMIEDLSLVWSDDEAPTLADASDLARAVFASIDRDELAHEIARGTHARLTPRGMADAILAWLTGGEPRG